MQVFLNIGLQWKIENLFFWFFFFLSRLFPALIALFAISNNEKFHAAHFLDDHSDEKLDSNLEWL